MVFSAPVLLQGVCRFAYRHTIAFDHFAHALQISRSPCFCALMHLTCMLCTLAVAVLATSDYKPHHKLNPRSPLSPAMLAS